ncbi:hypothetical protein [Sphingomonas bacterium]|uniref:hypothetical protein n=1 Tax=Sphingomonas bacterium TaxID=1895847 RepID=UPI001575A4F2|nr:hypothetical protein [Sphingomonas bacterium]
MIAPRPIILAALLLVGGCVGRTIDAPSLQPRAIEKEPVPVPDEAREPISALDPALAARIGALLDQAQAAHAGFQRIEAHTAAIVSRAANAPAGSEPWTAAQQEVSALDTARGLLHAVEADVDLLRADPANAAAANRAAIDAAGAKIAALTSDENTAVAALSARLRP